MSGLGIQARQGRQGSDESSAVGSLSPGGSNYAGSKVYLCIHCSQMQPIMLTTPRVTPRVAFHRRLSIAGDRQYHHGTNIGRIAARS
jgi:hypothetical protein